jgi:glycosyltransferase involved in cell wall biosynthesis
MLLVSPVIPSLIYRGSQLRAAEMIRALIALGCRVSLAVLNNSLRERPSREIARELRAEFPSVESIEVLRHPRFNTGVIGRTQRFGLLVADEITAGRHRISNLDSCPPNLRRVVAQMCKELRPRFLLVNYAKLAPVVPADFEGIAILDTHDYQTQLLKEDQEVNRVRRIINRHIYQLTEHAALKRFDRIIAINPNEEQTFREIVPSTPTFFVPAFCRPAYIDSKIFWSFPYDALFVGSMSTHNVRSLLWFAQSPNFRMAVVGNIIRAKKLQGRSFAGVEYLGVVPNLRESYETARCVIAPILGGAGMKIKVIEALGHGKAVVATSRALDGIRAKHGEHIIREDRPQDFAEAVLRIAEDNELRHRLERGARELHARDHSFAAITATLRKVTE